MKKAQYFEPITANVKTLSHEGRGIAILDGKTTFISGALANEEVICKLTKKHSNYNEAEVVEVLTPSPQRITPHCQHFGSCGGCSLQHMQIESQVQFKQSIVLEQLQHFGKVVPEMILPPITGNPWGYRRKARLGVHYSKKYEQLKVGFRSKSSNSLLSLQSCPVLHESVGTRVPAITELIRSLSQFDKIPQVEMAVSDQETALIFRHLADLTTDDIAKLQTFAKTHDFHIYLQPNSPAKVHKIWPLNSAELITYQLPDYQLDLQFHPLDFIQVNAQINQRLLKQALELLDPTSEDTVLDLFCGLGNFTLPIARYAQHVVGVEGSKEMVARGTANAKHNNLNNIEFYAANLMKPEPAKAEWMKKRYTKILIDPPRAGAKEILPLIANFSAKRITYVSCNPATLARDAGVLVYTHNYKLKAVGIVNMFPHTSHIEAIALFEK
ncbi:MAG: 23S rRNA (uracil(1939)-C(5))-methyltransferase RlmD [Gammaproteobacteria bacterium]